MYNLRHQNYIDENLDNTPKKPELLKKRINL